MLSFEVNKDVYIKRSATAGTLSLQ